MQSAIDKQKFQWQMYQWHEMKKKWENCLKKKLSDNDKIITQKKNSKLEQ